MSKELYLLPIGVVLAGLIVLAREARKRREEIGLGNEFLEAIKDERYRTIIFYMVVTVIGEMHYIYLSLIR